MTALSQSNFLQALGWAVLNSLWQLAFLWVVFQFATAVLRLNKPTQKSSLSTVLLYAGFAWFIFTFVSILLDKSAATNDYAGFMDIHGDPDVNTWLHATLPLASMVYLLLLVLPVLNFIRNFRYVQVIRRHGLAKADVKWRMFVQKVAAQMGINKPVQVWMSEFVSSPVTVGYIKPLILLPMAAMNHLTLQQAEAVLLHELSHIRRFDYLTNLITRIIQTILYFNPFVKAFARIIEREREKSCDDMVIQFQYEPHGYATALLALEKAAHLSRHSLAVPVSGGKRNELLHRIESILGIQKKQVFSFNRLAGVLAALLCFIALNALLLLSRPGKTDALPGLFTEMTSPLLFSQGLGSQDQPAIVAIPEVKDKEVVNHSDQHPLPSRINEVAVAVTKPAIPKHNVANNWVDPLVAMASPYMNVNYIQKLIPQLDPTEEAQLKIAVDASKKVLEEGAWKVVEKSIADAMTTAEKTRVKIAYKKELNKADWNKMEANLRLAYDQINWPRVNTQLNYALNAIKLDSLQMVYNIALENLTGLQKELATTDEQGIPDTDITVRSVEEKKTQVEKVASQLRAVRTRKIIHL